jgi:hypothetical protein
MGGVGHHDDLTTPLFSASQPFDDAVEIDDIGRQCAEFHLRLVKKETN